MTRLEDILPNASFRGILPEALVTDERSGS
jgi:hypothetical protein